MALSRPLTSTKAWKSPLIQLSLIQLLLNAEDTQQEWTYAVLCFYAKGSQDHEVWMDWMGWEVQKE